MALVTTLNSATTSAVIPLNPIAKTTIVQLSFAGTSSCDVSIQVTLDDPGSGAQTWSGLSTTHYSSVNYNDGVLITVLSPIAGLRLSSSTFTNNTSGNTITLKALQSVTA